MYGDQVLLALLRIVQATPLPLPALAQAVAVRCAVAPAGGERICRRAQEAGYIELADEGAWRLAFPGYRFLRAAEFSRWEEAPDPVAHWVATLNRLGESLDRAGPERRAAKEYQQQLQLYAMLAQNGPVEVEEVGGGHQDSGCVHRTATL